MLKIHNFEMAKFLQLLDEVSGQVWLETEDGDLLNLKSKLSQLIGLRAILESGELVEANLKFEDPDDEARFFRFNLFHEE